MSETPKILIVGAGPAGTAVSYFLSSNKVKHTLIDKSLFPRDKICGDALSGKVVQLLKKMNPEFINELSQDKFYTGSFGVSFFAPSGDRLNVPFSLSPDRLKQAPGFIARRLDFDNYLLKKTVSPFCNHLTGTISKINRKSNKVSVEISINDKSSIEEYDIIVGCDGDRSMVSRSLAHIEMERDHYCAGIRIYYKYVKDTHPENFIELHFLKELLPGYLWIFPMNDGLCNVGVGMLSTEISKRKVNLRKTTEEILSSHPILKERFKDAEIIDPAKGWGLPLGSKRRKISGDNFLLCGDAAHLIDPFTGEGIGNAMISGKVAAESIMEAIKKNDYSSSAFTSYDETVYRKLGSELKLSHTMQKLAKHQWLFNFVVKKANKSKSLRTAITAMFEDIELRKKFSNPLFYLKMIFNQ